MYVIIMGYISAHVKQCSKHALSVQTKSGVIMVSHLVNGSSTFYFMHTNNVTYKTYKSYCVILHMFINYAVICQRCVTSLPEVACFIS